MRLYYYLNKSYSNALKQLLNNKQYSLVISNKSVKQRSKNSLVLSTYRYFSCKSNIKKKLKVSISTDFYRLFQFRLCWPKLGKWERRILTGMLWSFLPLWEEATCARYWMTFFVFSVFPAPDSPLRQKNNAHKNRHPQNSVGNTKLNSTIYMSTMVTLWPQKTVSIQLKHVVVLKMYRSADACS